MRNILEELPILTIVKINYPASLIFTTTSYAIIDKSKYCDKNVLKYAYRSDSPMYNNETGIMNPREYTLYPISKSEAEDFLYQVNKLFKGKMPFDIEKVSYYSGRKYHYILNK